MIVFENEGSLDIRAVKTFGVSSKDNKETAIGYFGTGLKYAIAILLRVGQEISIVTNGTHYKFGTSRTAIRNDEFDIVTMNDQELGFTTELGKDWELWMAFRELFSNMLDENGEHYKKTLIPKLHDDRTYIMVKGKDFERVYDERDKYFLPPTVHEVASDGTVTALRKNKDLFVGDPAILYFRGIRVSNSMLPGLFDYNFHAGLKFTEDRTIKSGYTVNYEIAAMVAGSKDRDFIRQIVTAQGVHEAQLDFTFMRKVPDMEVFLSEVGSLRKLYKDVGINASAVALHKKQTKVETTLPRHSVPMTDVEIAQLKRATDFCRGTLKCVDIDEFKTIVVNDLGSSGQLGRADMDNGIMYISKQCFKEGTKRVAVALLEEYTHCKERVHDETVEQKWVYLNLITTLGEEIEGRPL